MNYMVALCEFFKVLRFDPLENIKAEKYNLKM